MKNVILLVVLTMIMVTGCGQKKVILGHDEPEFRPIEVREIETREIETVEVETILWETVEIETFD